MMWLGKSIWKTGLRTGMLVSVWIRFLLIILLTLSWLRKHDQEWEIELKEGGKNLNVDAT